MRLKDTLIFWTDVAIALLMAGLVATGTIIKWVLPPGSGRGDVGGPGGEDGGSVVWRDRLGVSVTRSWS